MSELERKSIRWRERRKERKREREREQEEKAESTRCGKMKGQLMISFDTSVSWPVSLSPLTVRWDDLVGH